MPAPVIVQPGYSFGTELGRSLGGGLGKGLEQGMSSAVNNYYKEKDRVLKGLPAVASQMRSAFKAFDPDGAFSPEQRRAAEERAVEMFKNNPGIDAWSAQKLAFDSLLSDQKSLSDKLSSEQGAKKKSLGERFKEGFSPSFSMKDVGNALNPIPALRALNPVPGMQEELQAKKEANRQAPPNPLLEKKPIIEMTPQELGQISQERFSNLTPQEFEQYNQKIEEAGQREATANWIKGLVPGYERVEQGFQEGGLVGPDMGPERVNDLMKLVGGGQRLAAQIGTLGAIPGGNIPQAAGGALMFGGSEALDQLSNPNGPDPSAIVREGALGSMFGPLGRTFEKIAGYLKRIPTAAKAIAEGAKAAGVSEEKIVEEAVQNLEKRGISVDKLEAGDAGALNELQKEAKKVSDLHQKADKFNQKELEKVRADVTRKLPESPLEEYYKPVDGPKTAEAVAREEARVAELEKAKKPLERRMQNLQYSVLSREADMAANRGKWTPEILSRQEAALQLDRMGHERALNDVKNLEFEIRNKKPRSTDEQIEKQISEQHAKFREHITNPNYENLEKARKRIADDQKALIQAETLAARGEIPGPRVMDEYIKIHKEYQKAYKTLQDDLKGFIREHKKDKEMVDQVQRAGEVLKLVERAQQVNAAKVNKQIDKRLVKHHLDKPSGAFYKQKLKDIRSDVDAFKKDFFQAQKAMGSPIKEAHKTVSASSTGFKEAFDTVKGATSRQLYEGIFDSLKKGKDTFAGIKDPLISRAKPYFDKGLIKSPEDISLLVNKGPGSLSASKHTSSTQDILEKTNVQAGKISKETKAASELKSQQKASKTAEEAVKNPTQENVSKLAKEAGVEKEKVDPFVKGLHEDASKLGSKVKSGTVTDQDIAKASTSISSKAGRLQIALRGVKRGAMIGVAQAVIEEITGEKIPQSMIIGGAAVLVSGGGTRVGQGSAFGSAGATYKLINGVIEWYQAERLRNKRNNYSEFNKATKELRDHYSSAKAKRIIKKATQG